MKNTLTVFAQKPLVFDDHYVVPVYWSTGKTRKKALRIQLALSCQDSQSIAEVVAIRYLLSENLAYNRQRTGVNLKIVVSKGAIKKMVRQSTDKHELYEFGYPLLTRYAEAEIVVSKESNWIPEIPFLEELPILNGEAYRGIESFSVEALGDIGITRHALDRYREYCGTNDLSTTWKNLCRRLNSKLELCKLPPNVILHKIKKYGDSPEVWRNPESLLHYVFCRQYGQKVLVTLYEREPEEDIPVFRSEYENFF